MPTHTHSLYPVLLYVWYCSCFITCSNKKDSRSQDDVSFALIETASGDANPSHQQQDRTEDGEDVGSPDDPWRRRRKKKHSGEERCVIITTSGRFNKKSEEAAPVKNDKTNPEKTRARSHISNSLASRTTRPQETKCQLNASKRPPLRCKQNTSFFFFLHVCWGAHAAYHRLERNDCRATGSKLGHPRLPF